MGIFKTTIRNTISQTESGATTRESTPTGCALKTISPRQ